VQSRGPALVAWEKICRPKNQGGLGVLDLTTQTEVLLLKNLHKFFNRHDIPWVKLVWSSYYSNGQIPGNHMEGSFWWKAHLKLLDKFKGISQCNIGDGKTSYLWIDNCLFQKFPHLASFAKKMDITVHEAIHTEFLEDLFHLPMSQEAYTEFQDLEILCEATYDRITSGEIDKWSYIWNSSEFSTQKAYKALIGYQQCPPHFTWIWNTNCQAKHKFFF
jgi:hypothetical protein